MGFSVQSSNNNIGIGMNHTVWKQQTGKTIFFIRHAEARHNVIPSGKQNDIIVTEIDYSFPDPSLTKIGGKSAAGIRNAIPVDALANVQLIISSPMRRCIQTSLLAFGRLFEWQQVPLILDQDLQETSVNPCDCGTPSSQLEEEFPMLKDEIDRLPLNWYMKTLEETTVTSLVDRARRFLKRLQERPEKVIFVVTHNGFLRYLLGQDNWMNSKSGNIRKNTDAEQEEKKTIGFENGEVRRFWMQEDGTLTPEGIKTVEETVNNEIEAIGFLG